MAKTLYLVDAAATTHRGDNTANLRGTTSWWTPKKLAETRGANTTGLLAATVTTVAGPTAGLEVGATPYEWLSEPLSADFTIAGTITLNLWAFESTNSANASINAVIQKIDGATGALTTIATSVRTTELGTAAAAANFTVAPTSTACKRGDRLRVRVFADDSTSSMGAALTVTFYYDRSTAAQGESFVTFTENLTFETTAPTGSTYYLTTAPTFAYAEQPLRDGTQNVGRSAPVQRVGQPFTAGGTLTELKLWLHTFGAPADNLIIEIQSDSSGSPSGTVMGTVATVAGGSLTTTATQYTYAPSVALTAGTSYWIVLSRSGAVDTSNHYVVGTGSTNALWPALAKAWNGTSWVSASNSFACKITPAVDPGPTAGKASTSRGSGSANSRTGTATGPTAPIQITSNTPFGLLPLEWYTPPLEAVTVGGMAKCNIRGLESDALANASLGAEVAVVAGDGTGAVVWGKANVEPATTGGEIGTSDAAVTAWVAGDDTSVAAGQRLRFRVYLDDIATGPLVTGFTVTVTYNGAAAAAAGDTYVVLPVAVVEQATATTWNGAATASLVDTVTTAATRETFTAATASLADTVTAAGVRETFAAATLSAAAAVTTDGSKVALGAATVQAAATVTTAGTRTAVTTAAVMVADTVTTAATLTAAAATTVAVADAVTTAATRETFSTATVAATDTVTTLGTRILVASSATAATASVTTAATVTARSSTATGLVVAVTTDATAGTGVQTYFGAATVAVTDTFTTTATRTTFATTATAETATTTTTATLTAAAAATATLTDTVTTLGARTAVGAATVGETATITTLGTATLRAAATVALTDTVTTAGARTTTGSAAVPLTTTVTTTGARAHFGTVSRDETVIVVTDSQIDVLATSTADVRVLITASADTLVPLAPGLIASATAGRFQLTSGGAIGHTSHGGIVPATDGVLAQVGS